MKVKQARRKGATHTDHRRFYRHNGIHWLWFNEERDAWVGSFLHGKLVLI